MRLRLSLAAVLLAAFLIRGFSFFCYTYPTGADYGHHTFYGDQYLDEGRLPETFPFYQLGGSRWSNLPGGAVTYALVAALAGRSAFELAGITALFTVIEVAGVYLLALRLFQRSDRALTAALIDAFLPSGALMVAWSAYANIIALALIPFGLLAWLEYWEKPGVRSGLLAVVVVCGISAIHHLSTVWLGLTLVVFSLASVALHPRRSLPKLVPIAIAGCLVGLPVLYRILELSDLFASGGLLDGAGRFDATRLTWSHWSSTVSAIALVLVSAGLALFLTSGITAAGRLLVGAYAAVSLFFGFGWLFGLDFYYVRALYFLGIPTALGASALFGAVDRPFLRVVVTASVATALGVGTLFQADFAAEYYEGLSPGVVEAAEWLREFSEPDDVIVVGTAFGYHMPRLLRRPVMVALTPDLVGNPDDAEVAKDAVSILMGLDAMDEALERRNVKYIIVKARPRDLPDDYRSRAVMAAHPALTMVFRNGDALIYGVGPL